MNWLDSIGQMFGGQQQPAPMDNPYQVQDAYQRGVAQKRQAQDLLNPVYQGGGKAGILAGVLGLLRGRQLDKRADETITQALGRQFELDRQQSAAAAEKARLEDEAKWKRELARIEAGEAAKAKYRAPKEKSLEERLFETLPENMRGQAALGKFGLLPKEQAPREMSLDERLLMSLSPEQREAAIQQRFNIAPKEKTLTAADIKLIQAEDMRRVSLDNATDVLKKMQQMTDEGVGGPIAALGLNPFTNRLTPQGKAIESYDAAAAELANEITRLTRIPGIGAQSDAELRAALAAIPTSDKSEETRKEVLAQIAKKIERLKASPTFFELSGGQFQQPNRAPTAQNGQFAGFTITRVD